MTARRPLIFGEVLFDCFPDGSRVLGGAPFNVAWHLQAFGMAPLFVSRVGRDPEGARIRQAMSDWGLSTAGLQSDAEHPTGRVEVRIEDDEPAYEIVTGSAWDHIAADELPAGTFPLLYHGSLAGRSGASAAALVSLRRRGTPVFVDVNLRPPWWQRHQVLALLQGARWIKLNRDELAALSDTQLGREADARRLLATCPGAELLLVTDGEKGALALTPAGELQRVRPPQRLSVVDTVGAGDAFASVIILGLLVGWPLPQLLERAQQFAAALVGIRGATCNDPGFYKEFIRDWSLE